jgi:hypothetical protein
VTAADDRVFVSQTPRELVGLFKRETGILAQKQADVFYGKWMRLSGRLDTITPLSGNSAQVTFAKPLGAGPTVFMMLIDGDYIDELSVLKKGTRLTVEGKIERIDPLSVQLTKCRLVS